MKRKGFRAAAMNQHMKVIRQEMQSIFDKKGLNIHEGFSLETLRNFSWSQILKELNELAPTTVMLLTSMLTKKDQESLVTE